MMLIFILILTLFHHSISQTLFGTQTFSTSLASQTDLLQKLGVQSVRLLVSWRQLEYAGKSQYQSWYLDHMDKDIQAMTHMNIKIILQMAQTPCWASTSSNCTQYYYRPKNYSDYADTMAFLLNRYGNNIYAWEIWNEPNIKGSWLRPECQSTAGFCPRPADLNDDWMEYIDLVAAREYSQMVIITSQKMKAISSNVTILAGSLAGSDIDYLNEMYKSGIKDYYHGLAMHPYTGSYPQGTKDYGREYGPDECFLTTRASNFWCFKRGVERIRDYMVQQMESSKLIWFTEFGFSSFDGWNGAGLQGQADYLERAIDIIQTQWPFIQAACVYEYSDYGPVDNREGYFGLLDRNYTMKPSGLVFMKKVKNVTTVIT
jgi:hypothetical protein